MTQKDNKVTKKIITKCCEKMVVDEKDLSEGIYEKKGYEFEWEMDSELKFPIFRITKRRGFWKRFKLQEDIKLKYTLCPICGDKVWMNEPYNGWWILQEGYKVIEIKKWISEWKEFII